MIENALNGDAGFFDWAVLIAYVLLLVSAVLGIWRLVRGPSVPDRVVALDFLTLIAISFVGLTTLETARYAYLDVGIALALVGFLATVALSRYVFRRSYRAETAHD